MAKNEELKSKSDSLSETEKSERDVWRKLIKSTEFFKEFSKTEINALLEHIEVKMFEKGEFVLVEKQEADAFYILLRGRVNIVRMDESERYKKIASLDKGDCFGEIAVLLDEPRCASIVAKEDCYVIVVALDSIENLNITMREKLFRQFAINLAKRLKVSSAVK